MPPSSVASDTAAECGVSETASICSDQSCSSGSSLLSPNMLAAAAAVPGVLVPTPFVPTVVGSCVLVPDASNTATAAINSVLESIRAAAAASAQAPPAAAEDRTTQDTQFECMWAKCAEVFNTPDELHEHVYQKHVKDKELLQCQWQGCARGTKQFGYPSSLMQHMSSHIPSYRPHKCPAPGCDYTAAFKWRIGPHFRKQHGTEEPPPKRARRSRNYDKYDDHGSETEDEELSEDLSAIKARAIKQEQAVRELEAEAVASLISLSQGIPAQSAP